MRSESPSGPESPDILLHIVLTTEPLCRGLTELGAAKPPAEDEVLPTKLVVGGVPSGRATPGALAWLKT